MKKFRQLVRENGDFESVAARTYKEKPNKDPMKKLKEEHPDVKFQKDMAAKERAKLQHLKATQQRKKYEQKQNEMEKQRLSKRLNTEAIKDKFDIGEYDQEGDMAK
jgi:septal ring factor EnvC (AmiA/AmiB activator)